jgi:hypothetical protein
MEIKFVYQLPIATPKPAPSTSNATIRRAACTAITA